MHSRHSNKDPIFCARKRVVHNAIMVLTFGGTFCLLLGFGIWQGWPAFMIFRTGSKSGSGSEQP